MPVYYDTTSSPNFYDLLGIRRDASLNDVKIAYRRTLLRIHPDKQPQSYPQGPTPRTAQATFAPISGGVRISDKQIPSSDSPAVFEESSAVNIALIKEAYETLSDAQLRTAYDQLSRRGESDTHLHPRPAQVVSLSEFVVVEAPLRGTSSIPDTKSAEAVGTSAVSQEWHHRCRCGGTYCITEKDLENDIHLVGCESCSEVIWVGYEEAMED